MGTPVAGLRGTGDFATDERPKNFREFILFNNPNGSAPLFALTSRMATDSVDDPEFSWWEESLSIARVEVGAAAASGDTTITLSSGGNELVPGDVLQVEKTDQSGSYDNELMQVTSITSDTSIDVDRGVAGTTAVALSSGDNLTRVSSAHGEGTDSPDVVSQNPEKITNYCQIFKTAYEVTGTATATRLRTGELIKNERRRKSFTHSEKIEQALLWGVPHEGTDDNGKPLRFTGGLRHFISSNVQSFTSNPTEDTFIDNVYPVFDYEAEGAGNERIVFAGNEALNTLNKLARDSSSSRINFDGVVRTYGMELQRWVLPQGTLYVRTHPLMNVHPLYKSSMFIIAPPNIKWRPLRNRDTKLQQNIQNNDSDTRKDQWLTEGGVEVRNEFTMGYIGNFHMNHA